MSKKNKKKNKDKKAQDKEKKQSDRQQAIDDLGRAIQLNPQYYNTERYLNVVYAILGMESGAQREVGQMIASGETPHPLFRAIEQFMDSPAVN